MKNRIAFITIVILLFYSFESFSQTIKWEDRMNGDNSVAGLQARGWVVLNEDGGGVIAPWFQGNDTIITTLEGPANGYVASNYNGANANGVIDQWLISPAINVVQGDTLYFWARSPNGSTFDDSINILISTTAGTTPNAFTSLGRFLVSTTGWTQYYVAFNSNSNIRFAIRYYIFDGGEFGLRSNYIGLDLFQLYTQSSGYPASILINKSFGFNNITQSSSYRMIGLPGNIDLPVSAPGTHKTEWNAFYDNGAVTDYLVEYTNSPTFRFKPGNGFWLLSKNPIVVNSQVNSVTLAGDNTYAIPLHSGWNIISNPFERSTSWAAVQNANGLTGNAVIHDWAGSWSNPTSFIPYKAFYFNNVTGLNTLKIPYDPAGTLGKSSEENTLQISGENDIKLSLNANGQVKSNLFIGFNSESTNDFDSEDYFAPPGDFDDTRIIIRNGELSTDYKYLMKESRREIGDGQIYNLEVKNFTGNALSIKFEGFVNYPNYLFYLVDERLNNVIKLSEDSEVKIAANVKNNSYRFLIGTQQFIDANKVNSVPTSFALYQNYPNPFNPTTVIRYSVPKLSTISIKVFNLLGNEIITLLNEEKLPGNYELEFDANSIASGVYFYKMKVYPAEGGAGTFSQSKKMILLR